MKRYLLLFIAGLAILLFAGVLVIRIQAEKIGEITPVAGADRIFTGRNLIVDMYAGVVGDGIVLFGGGSGYDRYGTGWSASWNGTLQPPGTQ